VEKAKKIADKFFSVRFMSFFGFILGVLAWKRGWWDAIEPITGLLSLAVVAATWWQTRRAEQATYADNGDGSWIIALQVGRPVSEAVKKQFGQIDALVDVTATIGTHTLSLPEHYESIARAVYAACCAGQGKNIHLVLSGPVALSCLIGQMIGLFHFQIAIYQFSPSTGSYEAMPKPTRAWLEHRS
jgi:hypothetical protein